MTETKAPRKLGRNEARTKYPRFLTAHETTRQGGYAFDSYGLREPEMAYGKGSGFHGKPGRSGPAKGNLNGSKNGTRLTRLTLGELPATMRRQTQMARKYRRGLEALVMEAKGEVNATDAHLIAGWPGASRFNRGRCCARPRAASARSSRRTWPAPTVPGPTC